MKISLPFPLNGAPLGADDEDLLCGRGAEIRTIVENCDASRLTVVVSEPGLGLSSLFAAGLVPELRRAGYITVIYSDWQGKSLGERLGRAVVRAIHEQADGAFSAGKEPLRDILARAWMQIHRPVAILLDQFSDYLRFQSANDISEEFDAELANAITGRAGRFVIGQHPDTVALFQRLGQFIPNLMGYSVTLGPLPPEAAKQLVEKTVARAGLQIEPAAVDQIVTAPSVIVPAAAPAVHPLFARLAAECLLAAESNLHSATARASTLAANAGVGRMLLESLDSPIHELGETNAELLFRWFPLLRGPDGRRLQVSEQALLDYAGKWNRFALALLPVLTECGMLRALDTPAGKRYELARDAVATVAYDWWQRREADIIARRRAAFRVRSISIAVGAILLVYLIYLFMPAK